MELSVNAVHVAIGVVVVLILVLAAQRYMAPAGGCGCNRFTPAQGVETGGSGGKGPLPAGQPMQLAPASLQEAQAAAWHETTSGGSEGAAYNTESGGYEGSDVAAYHQPAPGIDYSGSALLGMVATPDMRRQHESWHAEVAPKSQTSLVVDDMDEAAAISSFNGVGINAFQFSAPKQSNALFLTDQNAESYAKNATRVGWSGHSS